METIEVRPGQVWADNDPRHPGRTLRVDAVQGDKVSCTVLTNDDETQQAIDRRAVDPTYRNWTAGYQDRIGKQTAISLRRFRPTSTGYRLVTDTPEEG